ncbi:uridine 5'-monophosphate synthase [Iris pallida]|uniref:Uridine 5'-monophosphate synthase n=1 Tax=Iris pallida TaxID=29817 RepID=A0AAX6E6W6_IRIPA|nr:uridine 5'-monophosphate synthase [Iris pallida]
MGIGTGSLVELRLVGTCAIGIRRPFLCKCLYLGSSVHEDWLDRSRGIEDLLGMQKLSFQKMMSSVYKGHNVWNMVISCTNEL